MLVLPLLLGLSSQVAAQQQGQTEPEQKVEQTEGGVTVKTEVSVTGSLIARKDLEALSPVTVINIEDLTYQGTGRVEDLIQQLPQAFAAQNSTISNGASGTATVQLRQLGAVRTLALINGRRMASGDVFAPAADLNFIPSALVKRVDLLTGGASSAYGADAVAGVVNFVLDTEFQGIKGEIQYNGYQHNNSNSVAQAMNAAKGFPYPTGSNWDNGGTNLSLAMGGKFDGGKGHASAFVDYRDIAAIWKDQRDYTNCAVGLGADGPICGGSGTWQYGRFVMLDENNKKVGDYVLDPATGNTNTFRARTSADVFNYGPYNYMQRNDRLWGGGAFAHYTVNKNFEPYAEVMFMDDRSDAQIAPSGNFNNTTTINCDNPMMSDQQHQIVCGDRTSGTASLIVGRRNVEGGNRTDQLAHTNWRLLAGVRGDISPAWNYDVYGMKATVDAPDSYINDLYTPRIGDALDVVGTPGDPSTWSCRSGNPGCAPWNIFQVGGVTRAATDYMGVTYLYNSGTDTKMLGATVRGDLESAGVKSPSATEAVRVAIGTEIRKESVFLTPDLIRAGGLGAGSGGPTLPVDGSYTTKEGFAEALVPLVQDKLGVQDLSLELGYRFARYQASSQSAKNNSSFKALLSYMPIDGVRIRGGFNRAVRAPNVTELFTPQGLGLNGNEDICAGESPSASLAECERTGVTPAQYGSVLESPAGQYNSFDGGNPQLDVERANTITAGVVWTPKSITGLSLTLDFYDIKISNTISSFAPDDTIRACASNGNPEICSLIHRDAAGTLWLLQSGYTISTNQNIGGQRARGLDVSAAYPLNLGNKGFINFSILGSIMMKNALETPLVNYDCVGYFGNQCGIPSPKWRHRARASWNTKFGATFSLDWRYINKVLIDDAALDQPDLGNAGNIEEWKTNGSYENPMTNYFDLSASYKIRDGLQLTVGCNNILDKEPPLGPGLTGNDYGTGWYGTYDPLGRALHANLNFSF